MAPSFASLSNERKEGRNGGRAGRLGAGEPAAPCNLYFALGICAKSPISFKSKGQPRRRRKEKLTTLSNNVRHMRGNAKQTLT